MGSGCQIGSALVCDDNDECTEDQCDPDSGCVSSKIDGCGDPPILECSGSSIELDGSSCIEIDGILEDKMPTLTIEFWTSVSDPAMSTTILDKRTASLNGPGFEIRSNFTSNFPEKLHYDENRPPTGSASGLFSKDKFPAGEWHHFAVTRSEPAPIAGYATRSTSSDCAASCPAEAAQGCICVQSPLGGKDCVAECTTHSDCPTDGPGKTLVCKEGSCRRYTLTIRIFVDGAANITSSWKGSYGDLPNDKALNIGCRGDSAEGNLAHFFLGRLEELRISDSIRYTGSFDVATEPFEVDANTVALYHFEEGSGQQVLDSSGNNHHGQWIGNAMWNEFSPIQCPETDP